MSTIERSPERNCGSHAHLTSVARTKRSSAERCDSSPPGASVSAKSMISASDLPSDEPHPQVVLEDLQRPARIPRHHLGEVGAVHRVVAGERPAEILLGLGLPRRGCRDERS